MDAPITDPTLSAFYAPTTEAERIYFAAHYTQWGELEIRRIVEPAATDAAQLKIDMPSDSEQGDG